MTLDVKELAREIAVQLDPLALLDSDYVAGLFKCSARYFTEVVSKRAGFPKPVSLTPSGHPRYLRNDIEQYLEDLKNPPKQPQRGRPRKTVHV